MNGDPHALTGAYALDALTAQEREQFEQHLHECADCRTEVAQFVAAAGRLGSADAQEPPEQLKARVLAEVASTRQDAAPHRAHEPRHLDVAARKWRRATLLTAAAAVLALIAGGTTVVIQQRELTEAQDRSEQIADVIAAPDAQLIQAEVTGGGTATAVVSAEHDAGTLILTGLAPTPAERTYQLWLIEGDQAASAGTVDLSESTPESSQVRRVLRGIADADAIGLTIEPTGGSEQPTSDPLVALEL